MATNIIDLTSSEDQPPAEDANYICKNIRSLFNDPTYSDVTVVCGETRFYVHKGILACQEGYFSKAVKSEFEEGTTNLITLSEDENVDIVKVVLGSLYGVRIATPPWYKPAVFAALIYAAGDYYQMPRLRNQGLQHFSSLAFPINDPMEGAKACLEAVEEVYTTTPESDRTLRDIVVEAIHKYASDLIVNSDDEHEGLLEKVPKFAFDLYRHSLDHMSFTKTPVASRVDTSFACPDCGLQFGVVSRSNTQRYDWKNRTYSGLCPGCGRNTLLSVMEQTYDRLNPQVI